VEYSQSEQAVQIVEGAVSGAIIGDKSSCIRACTACHWLATLWLEFAAVKKGVFVNGHERNNVVKWRQEVFIPEFEQLYPLLVCWTEDGYMLMPANLPPGVNPHVVVTHDESTFKMPMMENGSCEWKIESHLFNQRKRSKAVWFQISLVQGDD